MGYKILDDSFPALPTSSSRVKEQVMKVICLKQALYTAAVLALFGIATSALAQFVWLDEKGVK